MKKCPDCGAHNRATNLFCPECGHDFTDERLPTERERPGKERDRRRTVALVGTVVVILGVAAGIVSYLVSRQIELSRLVTVESGTRWKCTDCGKVYRQRIAEFDVKRSERDQYGVETVDGVCYTCKYGEQVGRYQDLLDVLSEDGFFHGFAAELDERAAAFMKDHPDLLPAGRESQLAGMYVDVDPRELERDFSEKVGKVVRLTCTVAISEVLTAGDGAEATFMQLVPRLEGRDADVELLAVYPGRSPLFKGDEAVCYLLPADLVKYTRGDEARRAVLCIALYMAPI